MRLRRHRRSPSADGGEEVSSPPLQTPSELQHPTPVTPLADPEFIAGLRAVPSTLGDTPVAWEASDLSGVLPDGSPFELDFAGVDRPVLLVFLSVNCDGCDLFWSGLRNAPPLAVDTVVVTKGPATVSADEIGGLASGLAPPVVMSETAWTDFRVTSYPFLVLVESENRRILGERVGFGWSDIESLLGRLEGS